MSMSAPEESIPAPETTPEENNARIMKDIQSLQTIEQQLINSLDTSPAPSAEEKEHLIEKINQVATLRQNLYETLGGIQQLYTTGMQENGKLIKDQIIAINVIEKSLNRAKRELAAMEQEKNTKIRMVEITDYYGDKYAEHTALMKIVIATLLPIIAITFLYNNDLLFTWLYRALLVIIAAVGGYYFWIRYFSIITRDSMNYDEYDWAFNPGDVTSAGVTTTTTTPDPWAATSSVNSFGTCIGNACCSTGSVYDSTKNQCVLV